MSTINLQDLPREIVDAYLQVPMRNEFIPVRHDAGVLTIWVLSDQAQVYADFLAWKGGMRIESEQVPETKFYPVLEQALALWEEDHSSHEKDEANQADDSSQELLGWSHDDAPIVRLVNKTMHQAISQGASDIHLEGQDNAFFIRFRLDGELNTIKRLDKSLQTTIIARIKVMGDMDVAESRVPQDGRIQVKLGQKSVDIRVSTMPTMNGEKAVLRILDRSKNILSLPDLGMEGKDLDIFRQSIAQPHGIVLVTGPTGSGKTTTLYAGLSELVREETNIMTVEDPVEYHLAGVNQVQVNRAAGVTFASTIRAFLRQDPDIILVGEVRDQETASTAVQASLTGHLVLTTLHTNDAATAVSRLLEMGLEPFLLASSLTLVMGQRLVRVNCPHCKEQVPVNPSLLDQIGEDSAWLEGMQFKGRGCEHCLQTGFKGRRGIFEFMPVDEAIRGLVMEKASVDRIKAKAREAGFRTMLEHGLALVREGVTPLEEVIRVTRL
jgi:general secretion pathway protein E